MKLQGSDILVKELIRQGVDTVFGYPGGTVIDIFDSLYKNADDIKVILPAHEQGAAHAADGYARVTGKTGVVLATSGPGATNLITGIATAYLDSVPIVAITGNVANHQLGKDSFQEVDTIGITLPIVKHSFIVRDVNDLEEVIVQAFAIAQEGRPGPVLIDIPKSTQNTEAEYKGNLTCPQQKKHNKTTDLKEALDAIKRAHRPFIYVGGGTVGSDAGEDLIELSRRIDAPISTSLMGTTAVPGSYELNLGPSGMHGKLPSIKAQDKADLIIGFGTRFSDRATGNVGEYTKNKTFIQIDIDQAEFGKNIPGIIEVTGDAGEILQDLLANLPEIEHEGWIKECKQYKEDDELNYDNSKFEARTIIKRVNDWAEDETVVATDVGQHQMWTMQHYSFEKERTFLTSGGLGTMGYGMGAAIGGCVGNDRKPTVLFTGDGSFGMNLNEVATAVMEKLPILIVVLNNKTLGMVRQWQTMFYEMRYSSTDLSTRGTDFVKLADAFGAQGARVTDLEELDQILARDDLFEKGPFILECMIGTDDMVFPMIPAGASIQDMITDYKMD